MEMLFYFFKLYPAPPRKQKNTSGISLSLSFFFPLHGPLNLAQNDLAVTIRTAFQIPPLLALDFTVSITLQSFPSLLEECSFLELRWGKQNSDPSPKMCTT